MNLYRRFALGTLCGFMTLALSACGDKATSAGAIDNGCPDGGPCMEYDAEANTLKDLRDKQVYRTVSIGEQTWMAENMNYSMSSYSWCYNKSTSHCEKYGSLYTWDAAKVVCPDGWKLPNDDDWNELFKSAGGLSKAGDALKSSGIEESEEKWKDDGNGNDSFDFTVLPGGDRDIKGKFNNIGEYAFFWSASTKSDGNPYIWRFGYDESSAGRSFDSKDVAVSVRCIKK